MVKSDALLSINDLKVSPDSEAYSRGLADPHTIKINVATIRPSGLVSLQLITPVSNQVSFSELAENAQIITAKDLQAQKQKTSRIQAIIIGLCLVIWLGLVITVCTLIWKMGKWWEGMESGASLPELRRRLIVVIVVLIIYNVVLGSFGPLGGWCPLLVSHSEILLLHSFCTS